MSEKPVENGVESHGHGAVATPSTVRAAGAITALEGIIAVVVAIVLVIREAMGHHEDAISGYGTAAWFGIIFGGVLVGGLALITGRRWGRAIAVVAQILLLPVAYYMITSHQPWFGIPLGIAAVAVLVLLFSGPSLRWHVADYAPDAPEVAQQPPQQRPARPKAKRKR